MEYFLNHSEIIYFLHPIEIENLRMTCKLFYENKKIITHLIENKFNIKLLNPASNMSLAEFGVKFNKKSIRRKFYRDYYFMKITINYNKQKGKKKGFINFLINLFFKKEYRSKYFIYSENSFNQFNYIKNILYFEAIVKKKIPLKKCISIGFAISDTYLQCIDLTFLLGWLENSVGYHSDDGCIFYNGSKITQIKQLEKQDVLGIGFDIDKNVLFFVLNGVVIKKLQEISSNHFFPCIISDVNIDEHIILNYGKKPFLFNLQSIKA
jgi:hypothetical protein